MEKFSNWRDKGTGISPFLPVDPQVPAFRKFVINPALLALKWPLFVVLYTLASVAPKPATKIIFKWLFSVADIDLLVEGVRKSNVKEINAHKPSEGEIVVLNLVSPLDVFVIYLISSVSSLSSIVVVLPWKNNLYSFTVWQFLHTFFLSLENPVEHGTRLDVGAEKTLKGKLAIVFAEGTSSNNKAVLPLQQQCFPFLQATKAPVKVTVLRYFPGTLSLPVPNLTENQYVSRLFTLPGKAFVKVKVVPVQNVSTKACQMAFVENGLNHVELGLNEKTEFFKYFQNYSIETSK